MKAKINKVSRRFNYDFDDATQPFLNSGTAEVEMQAYSKVKNKAEEYKNYLIDNAEKYAN